MSMEQDLREFIQRLEAADELVRIDEPLSTQYEIAAAIRYIALHNNKAAYFEKVKGHDIPIVANLLGSRKRLAMAFDVEEDGLEEAYRTRKQNLLRPKIVTTAPVQEVVIDRDIDICGTLPALTYHQRDAGPYITTGVTIAKDPQTGVRGMGVHRVQVKDRDTVGIFLATPPLSHLLTKAEQLDKPLPIAIALGVGPLTFCAGATFVPQGVDKFEIMGGFAKEPIELVKCCSVDVEVPANAGFVLEGYIIPHRREMEGPFGESLGYYISYNNPVAKIKLITHRQKPIYHALVPFAGEEKSLLGMMSQVDSLPLLQSVLPQVKRTRTLGEIVVVQIEKRAEDDGRKVIEYLLTTSPFIKVAVVVDGDVALSDLEEVGWAVATRVRPDKDVVIKPDLPGFVLDPSASGGEITADLSSLITRTAKLGIDATKPLAELERFEKVDVPAAVKEKVSALLERLLKLNSSKLQSPVIQPTKS